MTFFDWRPNNRAIDFFGSAPKVHCNSLRAAEAPHFFHLGDFEIPKTKGIWPQLCWGNFFDI